MTNEERLDQLQAEGQISGKIRKVIEKELETSIETPDQVIERLGLQQLGDQDAIEPAIKKYIAENRHLGKTVEGMVRDLMKENPKINPQHVWNRLQSHLKSQYGIPQ